MKFTKMSLMAALLIGSSAFAIENTKVSGDANVFYSTTDAGSNSLFDKVNSAADTGLNLNVTTDLAKNSLVSISAGAGYTVLSTLGLENNLVSNVWGGAHGATTGTNASYGSALGGAKVENANWMNEAWIAATVGKTTVKLGRMELDTPLVFTEKWSIEKNTFEGAVVINQDIPDTTLVGAYVGNGNGTETFGDSTKGGAVAGLGLAVGPVVNAGGKFTTYGSNGAYAVGAINNSYKPLTVQAWYYQLTQLASAYWLQADLDASSLGVKGLFAGAQYSSDQVLNNSKKSDDVYALMLGYEMKGLGTVKVAYSSVNKGGDLGYAGMNTATATGTAQSKLYTEAWWNYGQVTMQSTDAYNVTVEAPVKGIADFGLYYTYANHDKDVSSQDLTEVALTASKSFGPLDATAAYVYYDLGKNVDSVNMLQAYLTLNF